MTNSEIRYKYYSPTIKSIVGEMYGRKPNPRNTSSLEFIEINKKDLKLSVDGDCFVYTWGWPGPDCNFYEFKDYGITWAFAKEELNV